MKINFTKMHACGNDYIYIDCFTIGTVIDSPEALSVRLSQRRFGVGADGIVLILPSDVGDAKMHMFNADGSEGKMCGNAIRCVAKYLYDNRISDKTTLTIDTLSGIKTLEITTKDGCLVSAKVDMGRPEFLPEKIPVNLFTNLSANLPSNFPENIPTNLPNHLPGNLPGEPIIAHAVEIGGQHYNITCVSMGNPHAVIFCEDVSNIKLSEIGPLFERSPIFPERVNTEFVKIINRNHLILRVWERGSGETFGCGTGACAAAVAAVLNGHCDINTDINVRMPGGELTIRYTGETVYMTGGAVKTFEGVVEI